MTVLTERSQRAATAPAPARRRSRRVLWSYAYLAPMLVLLLAFVVYPIVASLAYSFYHWNGIGSPSDFAGLGNFRNIIHNSIFWQAVEHTFIYAAVMVPVQLALALVLALVLNSRRLRFASFYRTLFFLPVVTSAAVIGVVIQLIVSNFGDSLNHILLSMHIIHQHVDWLGDPRFALGIVIAVGIWQTLGYNLIYFLAGLQTIPEDLYEAARLDGAGRIATFRYITVPMLRAVGVVIVVLAVIGSFQVFDLVQVITGGGPYFATEVVNTYIYQLAFGGTNTTAVQPDIGLASAASFFYGLLLIVFAVVQLLVVRSLAKRRAPGRAR